MDPNNLPKFVYLHKNHKLRLKLGFYAAPSNRKLFSKAVKDELEKLKFTYCSDLNGLIMGFGKINSYELIQADTRHCISVAISVDIYIFRPPLGSVIEAVVNQTSDNHVSCLVHNLFNVSIVRPEHQPCDQWSGSKIKKDDKINVKVLSFDLTKKLPHITGEIADNETDECDIPKNAQDNYSEKSSSEKCESIKSVEYKQKDNVITPLKHISSDSESSDEEMDMVMTRSQKRNIKSIVSSTQLNDSSINNSKHIKNLFGNSTPISNSDHSLVNLNLMKNKQIENLQKHLIKNSAEKRKSLDSIQSRNHQNVVENNSFQSSNNSKGKDIKIDKQCAVLSDSGISGDDHGQNKFSNHSLFLDTSPKPSKTIEKLKTADKICVPLHSLSPNKNKSETNIIKKLSADLNINSRSSGNEENNVYTQHTLGMSNSEDAILNNYISPAKSTIKKPILRSSSTKSIEKNNSPEIQIENKSTKNHSNVSSTNSDSSSSEDINLAIENILNNSKLKQLTSKSQDKKFLDVRSSDEEEMCRKLTQNISKIKNETNTNKTQNETYLDSDDEDYTKLKQNVSKEEVIQSLTEKTETQESSDSFSSDDEIFTTLKQNISKKVGIKPSTKITQYQKFYNRNSSDNESNSSNKLFQNTFLESKRSNRHDELSSDSMSETNNSDQKKTSEILSNDSISNNEMECTSNKNNPDGYQLISKIVSDKAQISNIQPNEKNSTTLNKKISNPFIRLDTENLTSSNSEDDIFITSSTKSKSVNNSTKEKKKSELIQQVLSSVKYKDKQKLLVENINSDFSEDCNSNSKIKETKKLTKKNKKRVLKKLRTSIEKLKPNTENLCTDDSTDIEIYIKKILDKQKLNISEKAGIPEVSSTQNKLKKHKETTDIKFDKKSSKITTDELTGRSKANILNQSRHLVEEPKHNTLNINNSQIDNLLQLKKKLSTDESTDDENDFIKKIVEKRKLNLSKKTDVPEVINQNKLKKNNKTLDKNASRNSIEKPKPNTSIVNMSQIDASLQMKTKLHTDESTDEENDMIKNFLKKQKLNPAKKTGMPDTTNQTKLKKHKESLDIKVDKPVSRNSIEKLKPNTLTVNMSQIDIPLQLKTQPRTDYSTDDEIDFIKNIVEKRKFNLNVNSDTSEATNKTLKNHKKTSKIDTKLSEIPSDESFIKNKNKFLEKIKSLVKEPKLNTSTIKMSHIDVPLQLKSQFQIDNSTDDEIDFIKKIAEKQKLNVIEKTDAPEVTNHKLKKNKNSSDIKFDIKSSKITTEKLQSTIKKVKPNTSNVNVSQIDVPLQIKMQSQSDNSTDDEIDFIKKIAEKRKLNVNEQTDAPEVTNHNKLKKNKKSSDIKFDIKSSEITTDKLKSPIEKTKPNTSNVNVSQIDVPLQIKMQSQTDNSTDDEIDFIKKIAEKRKLNVNEKTDAPEVTYHSKLKKNKKSSDIKFDIKSSEITTDKLKSPIKNTKPNTSNVNVSQIDVPLHIKTQSQTDSSTDDEIDFIKKIAEKRKLNINEKTDAPEVTNHNKLKKNKKSSDIKFDIKSSEITTDKLKSTIEKAKPNTSNVNVSQIDVPLQIKMQSQTDNSTDDEIDFIKKIAEKQKLNINEKTDVPKVTNQNKLKKHKEPWNIKLHTKCKKSPEITTNESIDDKKKTKRKRPSESKHLLLDSLLNAIDGSDSNPSIPTKIKKKHHNSTVETNDLLKSSGLHLLEKSLINSAQIKNKKINHNFINSSNEIMVDDKIKGDFSSNPTPVKKKKKNCSLINETNDLLKKNVTNVLEDSSSNSVLVKKKKKKNNHSVNNEISDLLNRDVTNVLEDSSSNSDLVKKKKKKNNRSVNNEISDLLNRDVTNVLEDSSSDSVLVKKKKKKNNHSVNNEISDLLNRDVTNVLEDSSNNPTPIKKKKKNRSLINETNDLLNRDVTNVLEDDSNNLTPVKKKKKNHSLINETKDLSKNDITNVVEDFSSNPSSIKKKKKSHNLINTTEDISTNDIENCSNNHTKKNKKKKKILIIETDDLSKDKASVESLSKIKKKKKKINHYEDHNLNDSLAREDNTSTNKPKKKVKSRPIEYNCINTISADKYLDKNDTSQEKTGSTKKKKKKKSSLSKNDFESFLSAQNCEAINNLQYLYSK